MVYLLKELREQLIEDENLKIMFVEGVTDLRLWRVLLSDCAANDSVVYPISDVDISTNKDNNKQRCLDLARATDAWPEFDRLRFFVDADNDHIAKRPSVRRVFKTDTRDLETMVLLPPLLEKLCSVGLNANEIQLQQLKRDISTEVRQLGLLRAVSEINGLNLPFREAYPNEDTGRVYQRQQKRLVINTNGMITTLRNKQAAPQASVASISSMLSMLDTSSRLIADEAVVHGKDLISFLARQFSIDYSAVAGMIRLALHGSPVVLRQYPSILEAVSWLCG